MEDQGIRPIKILLVEDNAGDVRLAREALKEGKVYNDICVVSDGEEALAYLNRQGKHAQAPRPDLILLDLNLPKKSGQEVLVEIKNNPDLQRIPVIILTSSKAEQDVVKTYQDHANCYIVKPIELEQFIKVVGYIRDFWFTIVKLPIVNNGK